jgi:DNA-binding transcriptional LysR family regulator
MLDPAKLSEMAEDAARELLREGESANTLAAYRSALCKDGERVLAWARRVLADCEGLRQDARASEEDPVGTLRMGAIPASLPLVPMVTQCCMPRYPRMRHQIYTLSAAEILRKIGDFELDIGLSLDDERFGAFETVPVFRERYVLVAAEETMFEGTPRCRGPTRPTFRCVSSLPTCNAGTAWTRLSRPRA